MMFTLSLLMLVSITTQLQGSDKKPTHKVKQNSQKTKRHHNATPATDEEKKSKIDSFFKSVERIPKRTQNNDKEHKESIDKARGIYQKMYEFSIKKPLVLTKSEYQEMKKYRKKLSEFEAQLKKEELKTNSSKPSQQNGSINYEHSKNHKMHKNH